MGNFAGKLGAVLSQLAEWLGIKPSEEHRLQRMGDRLATAKANNADRLESVKDEIRVLESRARKKKEEYDRAGGETKRIVTGEIERTFRELDRLRGQERIIGSNIEKISVAQAKLGELRAARTKGVEEAQLDDIAVDLQNAFEELKVTDSSARDLERVEYAAPEPKHVDAESRLEQVTGSKEASTELPEEMQKRLKELELEE